MALLWMDGFDGMNTDGNNAGEYIRRRYTAYMDDVWLAQAGQHGFGKSLYGLSNALYTPQWPTTDRTLYIGLAFKETSYRSDSWIFQLTQPPASGVGGDLGTGIGLMYMTDEQEIQVRRGATVLWTTATGGSVTFGHWNWLEFKIYCDNTNGVVEIRRGGTTILSEPGDTQENSAVNYHAGLFINNSHSRELFWDNLYVCDSTGTKNNGFLGPSRVVTMLPVSDGDESDWTPQSGLDHYAMVDEMPLVDYNDFVDSVVVDDKDLWGYANVADIGDTIHAVQVITDAQSVDGAGVSLKTLTKTGVTETADSGLPLKTSFLALPRIMEVQPGGAGDWTEAALNVYQFGVQHAGV